MNILFCALTSQIIICIVYCRLARLTGTFKIILTQYCVLSDLTQKDIKLYVLDPFICKGPTSFRKYPVSSIQSVRINQKEKEHLLIWNSGTTQNLAFIFITTEQKQLFSQLQSMTKQLWHTVRQLFNFFKYFLHFELLVSNTIKMNVFI